MQNCIDLIKYLYLWQINPKFKSFRAKGIFPDFEALLDHMFMNMIATRDVTWCPPQGLISNQAEEVRRLDSDDVGWSMILIRIMLRMFQV